MTASSQQGPAGTRRADGRAWRPALALLLLGGAGWLLLAWLGPAAPSGDRLPPTPSGTTAATPRPRPPALISPATAVARAVRLAQHGSPEARLVGEPRDIRGRILPLAEADRLATGGSLAPAPPNDLAVLQRPTWLIVLSGQVAVGPPLPTGTPAPPTLTTGQMVVMFSAFATDEPAVPAPGDEIMVGFRPLARPVPVDSLPRLAFPTVPGTPLR